MFSIFFYFLIGMKYGVKTSRNDVFVFVKNVTEAYIKGFSKNLFMFIRPIIKQTKVHFKILELRVITFGTGP